MQSTFHDHDKASREARPNRLLHPYSIADRVHLTELAVAFRLLAILQGSRLVYLGHLLCRYTWRRVQCAIGGRCVAIGGEIVWAEGFGWADIDERRPVTPRTRFRIDGIAMTMTAVAVGLLVERGLLDIDSPVRDYVPTFPEKPWPFSTRQLMGHVAGVRHYGDAEEMLYRRMSCTRPLDALAIYADDPLLFEPGTAFGYSNHGWMLVAAVVEAAAGEPFLQFIEREVFEPADLGDTVPDDPTRPAPATTQFYWPFAALDTTTGVEFANNPDNTCLLGAAGLLSTPTDVVKFGNAMLSGRLLRTQTIDLLLTPLELESGESTGHGLGWSVRRIPIGPAAEPTAVLGHDRTSAGGTASLLIVPDYGLVIAATVNVSYAKNLTTLTDRLAGLFVSNAIEARAIL